MAAALKGLGFEVLYGEDLNKSQMKELIRQFGDKLKYNQDGGVGLFFYAGHGVQSGTINYLVPIDASIPRENEIEDAAVDIRFLLKKLDEAKSDLNIVMLDACRNNPFAKEWGEGEEAIEQSGLAKTNAPRRTVMFYAAEPGKAASDGTGKNGPFTQALLENIKKPDSELDRVIKDVRLTVQERTNYKQTPYNEGTNSKDFYFARMPEKSKPATSTNASLPAVKPPVTEKDAEEAEAWIQAKDSSAPEDFRLFLKAFPNGANAATARARLEKVLWESIKETNDITAVEDFLKEFPNGANKTAAQIRLNKLNKARQTTAGVTEPPVAPKESAPTEPTPKENTPKETVTEETAKIPAPKETVNTPKDTGKTRFQREAEAWSEVSNSTDSQQIRAFLENFPGGANMEKAKIRLEQTLWDERRVTKDKELIAALLKEFPNGANAPLARLLLLSLEKEKDKSSEETAPEESSTKAVSSTRTVGGEKKNNPIESKIAARSNVVGMEFVRIPAGSFLMGASEANIAQTRTIARKDYADFDQSQLGNEKPVRRVTFAEGFWMGKFEVTQAQWTAVMGENPSSFKGCDNCPVERVSWEMAKNFLRRLNELDDGYIYRLPSEAEWEYAARANTLGIFSGRVEEMSWHGGNSEDKTHPVGAKLHNPFGLHDIYGNVSEWCEDIYSPTYEGLPVDGSPNTTVGENKRRVIRGGHWNSFPTRSRSSFRESHPAKDYATHIGFRVVAVPK
jgi:formylglycine-generating enzyme required for sulfatase activity/TolA-binding protein